MIGKLLLVVFMVLAPVPALAVNPDEVLADPVLEQRARNLSAQLRCMVCQNQSIDDSNAPLARDLRVIVREESMCDVIPVTSVIEDGKKLRVCKKCGKSFE